MVTSREIDLLEQDFTGRGEAFFHVSGAGHEATAVLNHHLISDDWLHVHYRDKALMLARGISIEMFFLATFSKDASHSRGRQMNAHMSAPELNVLSLVGPVGNSALQAAGVAQVVKPRPANPIVLCALGDGMTQQGEVLEGIAHAVRDQLPVLFVIQDNSFAISTTTGGRTFYSTPHGDAQSFYDVPITRIDGRDAPRSLQVFGELVSGMRRDRRPQIAVFQVDRLSNHTNADDQRMYRSAEEIAAVQASGDPIIRLQHYLNDEGVPRSELDAIAADVREQVRNAAYRAQRSAEPVAAFGASRPLPVPLGDRNAEYRGDPSAAPQQKPLTMLESIREVLRLQMEKNPDVVLFGEDIEDPKGDVFGVTRGLTTAYGDRVRNSPLAEASIVGITIGQALAGKRPVAFLQFADFLPIAYNQIFAELGSMYWRTDGGWQAPVIVMVTCGGYKPGLGPFHASSLEALAAHTPGVDVFMPSTAGDAAGLLNAAFQSGRPTLFFYPKSCLNDRDSATSGDIQRHLVPIGTARFVRRGSDITLVGWGNTVPLCSKTGDALAEIGVQADVIDLRSIVPWDAETVLASAERSGRLVVVHEDNHTAGFGAEVVATVNERASRRIECRRVTRPDTYVPFNFANQLEVLPTYKRTLETAVALLGGQLRWKLPQAALKNTYMVEAIGSSPSDESITVVEWKIKPGETIESGTLLAELEADKAAVELRSPVSGEVSALLVEEGQLVKVGTHIVQVTTADQDDSESFKQVTRENPGTPLISEIAANGDGGGGNRAVNAAAAAVATASRNGRRTVEVAIFGVCGAKGSRIVSNREISLMCPQWGADDILKRTGIESRPWLAEGESPIDLATAATRRLLDGSGVDFDQIGTIICATETPIMNTPASAALIQERIKGTREGFLSAAYDVNAACSGYVYALQNAYDILTNEPDKLVLVVTTEALSPRTNTADPQTAPIFGDAATATLVGVTGAAHGGMPIRARLYRPVLGASGEDGSVLRVPADPADSIYMDGPKVFVEAVRGMIESLERACAVAGIGVKDLDLIVPHQANQRIINAVQQRARVPRQKVFSNIRYNGNTSSSTIPLCLETIFSQRYDGAYLGLSAFGGGFTFGGAVLRVV
ncbi:MAG: biotin/lipoyl-binding protein [Spirochaetaceae bacterium]|nr:MAG: biotin/lipoyl-binding protein [Spirochaetaceae bacterium]